jgi:hypothetical protein
VGRGGEGGWHDTNVLVVVNTGANHVEMGEEIDVGVVVDVATVVFPGEPDLGIIGSVRGEAHHAIWYLSTHRVLSYSITPSTRTNELVDGIIKDALSLID